MLYLIYATENNPQSLDPDCFETLANPIVNSAYWYTAIQLAKFLSVH